MATVAVSDKVQKIWHFCPRGVCWPINGCDNACHLTVNKNKIEATVQRSFSGILLWEKGIAYRFLRAKLLKDTNLQEYLRADVAEENKHQMQQTILCLRMSQTRQSGRNIASGLHQDRIWEERSKLWTYVDICNLEEVRRLSTLILWRGPGFGPHMTALVEQNLPRVPWRATISGSFNVVFPAICGLRWLFPPILYPTKILCQDVNVHCPSNKCKHQDGLQALQYLKFKCIYCISQWPLEPASRIIDAAETCLELVETSWNSSFADILVVHLLLYIHDNALVVIAWQHFGWSMYRYCSWACCWRPDQHHVMGHFGDEMSFNSIEISCLLQALIINYSIIFAPQNKGGHMLFEPP